MHSQRGTIVKWQSMPYELGETLSQEGDPEMLYHWPKPLLGMVKTVQEQSPHD